MEHKRVRASGHTKWIGSGVQLTLPRMAELSGNPVFQMVVLLLLQFSVALLLAQGRFLGRFAPFGAAFVTAAAAYPYYGKAWRRTMPLAALLGAAAGYLIAGGAVDGLKYCAASMLCYAAGLIFRGSAYQRRIWFAPAVAGGSLAATNLVFVLAASPEVGDLLLFGCEVLITAAAAFFYLPVIDTLHGAREDKQERPPNRVTGVRSSVISRRLALAAAGISLVVVLSDFTPVFGMSLGRMAALFLTLSAASAGALYGCAVGLVSGLAIDLALAGVPSISLVYAAAGLFAGAFRRAGGFWLTFVFTAAHAALIPWNWADAPLAVLYESAVVGILWCIGHRRWAAHVRRLTGVPAAVFPQSVPARSMNRAVQEKLGALTTAFETVREAVRIRDAPKEEDIPLSAYDIAVERVCRNCRINDQCWNREYAMTRSALNEATAEIRRRGRAHAQDFPPFFTARCENLGEFVANINENIALRESRSRYRRRAADDTRLLGAQYDAMTQVLQEFSAELTAGTETAEEETRALRQALARRGIALQMDVVRLGDSYQCRIYTSADMPRAMLEEIEDLAGEVTGRRMRMTGTDGELVVLQETETLRAVVGVGLRQRRGEEESGDSAAYFRTEDGCLYMIVADGMGSGRDAARESAAFVRMMESFLRAGVSVHTALRLLSPAFAVKCGGDSFTTCDILRVDLHTGESECYKCGAAPTYLCAQSERGVQRISSGSMPVGLPSDQPEADHTHLQLGVGDVVVMVSDGLSEPDGDEWLTALLKEHRFTSPSALASEILDAGSERSGGRDDMTVLVLKLSAMR